MKTQHLAGIAGLCGLLAAVPVSSAADMGGDPGWYFHAGAGVNFAGDIADDVELDAGFRFSAGVGYNINHNVAVEFDTGWIWNSFSDFDGSVSHIPLMVNGIFRYPISDSKWELYGGGGLGGAYTIVCIDDFGIDDSDGDIVFAWQILAGVRYNLRENMAVGAGYKYFGTTGGEYDLGGGTLDADTSHNHTIGLTFNMKF